MPDTDTRVPWLDLLLLFSASRLALLIVGIVSTGVLGSGLTGDDGCVTENARMVSAHR